LKLLGALITFQEKSSYQGFKFSFSAPLEISHISVKVPEIVQLTVRHKKNLNFKSGLNVQQ
jgi:hypothetical protein